MNMYANIHLEGNESIAIKTNKRRSDGVEYCTITLDKMATIYCNEDFLKRLNKTIELAVYSDRTYEELETENAKLEVENEHLREENEYLRGIGQERMVF